MRGGDRTQVTRVDLLWLAGAMWLGLGIAHDELILTIGAIVAFVMASRIRSKEPS